MTNEERGRDFLNYVARNEDKLKRSLAKNITFCGDIFDDVFHDTVIKVYEAIVERGVEVVDFKSFFFMASKRNYCREANRQKRRECTHTLIDDVSDVPETSDPPPRVLPELKDIMAVVAASFGQESAAMFMKYFSLRKNGRISYRDFAESSGYPYVVVKETLCGIRHFLKDNINSIPISNGIYQPTQEKDETGGGHEPEGTPRGLQHPAVDASAEVEKDDGSIV